MKEPGMEEPVWVPGMGEPVEHVEGEPVHLCLCGGLARFLHEVVLGLVVEQLLLFALEVELLLHSLLLLLEGREDFLLLRLELLLLDELLVQHLPERVLHVGV